MVEDVKFKIKHEEVIKQIESSEAGIKYKKRMEATREELRGGWEPERLNLVKKAVEYVSIFYMLMQKKPVGETHSNRDKIGEM